MAPEASCWLYNRSTQQIMHLSQLHFLSFNNDELRGENDQAQPNSSEFFREVNCKDLPLAQQKHEKNQWAKDTEAHQSSMS